MTVAWFPFQKVNRISETKVDIWQYQILLDNLLLKSPEEGLSRSYPESFETSRKEGIVNE